MKICREVPNLVKMGREYEALHMKTSVRLSSPMTSNRPYSAPFESSDIRLWGCRKRYKDYANAPQGYVNP